MDSAVLVIVDVTLILVVDIDDVLINVDVALVVVATVDVLFAAA